MTKTLLVLMIGASVVSGWVSLQHIGWLDGISNAAAVAMAFAFGLAAMLTLNQGTRVMGARIGFAAALIALVPIVFLTVVLLAFGGFSSREVMALLGVSTALTTIAVLAFKTARHPTTLNT